jgi:hypothetical protein
MFIGTKKELLKIAPQIFDVIEESYRHLLRYGSTQSGKGESYIDSYFGFATLISSRLSWTKMTVWLHLE